MIHGIAIEDISFSVKEINDIESEDDKDKILVIDDPYVRRAPNKNANTNMKKTKSKQEIDKDPIGSFSTISSLFSSKTPNKETNPNNSTLLLPNTTPGAVAGNTEMTETGGIVSTVPEVGIDNNGIIHTESEEEESDEEIAPLHGNDGNDGNDNDNDNGISGGISGAARSNVVSGWIIYRINGELTKTWLNQCANNIILNENDNEISKDFKTDSMALKFDNIVTFFKQYCETDKLLKTKNLFLRNLNENDIVITFHRQLENLKIGKPIGLSQTHKERSINGLETETQLIGNTRVISGIADLDDDAATDRLNPIKPSLTDIPSDTSSFMCYIDDAHIFASSSLSDNNTNNNNNNDENGNTEACFARLNDKENCWMPLEKEMRSMSSWICVDLGAKFIISRIDMQSHPTKPYWINSFWLDYSNDLCHWKTFCESEIETNFNKYYDNTRSTINLNINDTIVDQKTGDFCNDNISTDANFYQSTDNYLGNGINTKNTNKNINNNNNNKNEFQYDEISSHNIWPFIEARFIRIRPFRYHNKIALRMELYFISEKEASKMQYHSRNVQPYTLTSKERTQCYRQVENISKFTFVTQQDCKRWVRYALQKSGIQNNVDYIKQGDECLVCLFSTPNGTTSDNVLTQLGNIGFGFDYGTYTLCNTDIRREPIVTYNNNNFASMAYLDGANNSMNDIDIDDDSMSNNIFAKTIKTKKLLTQLTMKILSSAQFTFDYVMMLIVAACIAGGGLATDNAVIVVASMLVSPLMGPVLSWSFGTHLGSTEMISQGLKTELVSLVICVICGIIIGIPYAFGAQNRYPWPTSQMSARGEPAGLADGAFIAFVSGIGVALSVLEDYASTVVGVAISASLLPPAINCGMLLTFAFYIYIGAIPEKNVVNGHNSTELWQMALWSLLLTIENIILIYFVSLGTFKIKTLPTTSEFIESIKKGLFSRKENKDDNNKMGVAATDAVWDTMATVQAATQDELTDEEIADLFGIDIKDVPKLHQQQQQGTVTLRTVKFPPLSEHPRQASGASNSSSSSNSSEGVGSNITTSRIESIQSMHGVGGSTILKRHHSDGQHNHHHDSHLIKRRKSARPATGHAYLYDDIKQHDNDNNEVNMSAIHGSIRRKLARKKRNKLHDTHGQLKMGHGTGIHGGGGSSNKNGGYNSMLDKMTHMEQSEIGKAICAWEKMQWGQEQQHQQEEYMQHGGSIYEKNYNKKNKQHDDKHKHKHKHNDKHKSKDKNKFEKKPLTREDVIAMAQAKLAEKIADKYGNDDSNAEHNKKPSISEIFGQAALAATASPVSNNSNHHNNNNNSSSAPTARVATGSRSSNRQQMETENETVSHTIDMTTINDDNAINENVNSKANDHLYDDTENNDTNNHNNNNNIKNESSKQDIHLNSKEKDDRIDKFLKGENKTLLTAASDRMIYIEDSKNDTYNENDDQDDDNDDDNDENSSLASKSLTK